MFEANATSTTSRKLQHFALSGSREEGDYFYSLVQFTQRKFNKWNLMVGERLRQKPPATLVEEAYWDCRRNETKKIALNFKIDFLRSMIVKLTNNVQWSLKDYEELQSNIFFFWELYGIYLFTHAETLAVLFYNKLYLLQ